VPNGDEYLYSQRQSWTGSWGGRSGSVEDQGAEIDLRIACQTRGSETTISSKVRKTQI
jgi:hypothetical protein